MTVPALEMGSRDYAQATVKRLYTRLMARSPEVHRRDDYYRGEQRLEFVSDRFRDFQSERNLSQFSDNWCRVIADSPAERLEVMGFRLDDDRALSSAEQFLWDSWRRNDMDVQSSQGFLESGIASTSYVLVWGDPDTDEPTLTWEHPSQVIVDYDTERPRLRRAALKVWRDEKHEYATLYLPFEVWKYKRVINEWNQDATWEPRPVDGEPWPLPNPLGEVPIVEFPNRPLLGRPPLSEIQGAMALQDAINLLWAYLFTAADFASLPARVVMGAERPEMPVLDDQGQVVGKKFVELGTLEQGRMLWLTGQNASIGQWNAADLKVFTDVVEVAVGHLAAQTRTPQHYLIGKMANLSAESLRAAEAGLAKKVTEMQTFFSPAVRDVFRLMALTQDDQALADACRGGRVLWRDSETRSEAQLVDALLKLQTIGFPFAWLAENYGLSDAEIARLEEQRTDSLDRLMLGDFAATTGPKPDSSSSDSNDDSDNDGV